MSTLSEFLLTTGRTLAQMALYSPEHPTVKGAVGESHKLLTALLNEQHEIVVSTSENKVIVNGRPPDDVSDSSLRPFLQLLTAHELHSLSFLQGIEDREMATFFRLAAGGEFKRKGVNPQDFFTEQKITHIRLNEARYAKIGEDETVGGIVGAPTIDATESAREQYENLSLNELLKKMIDRAVPNPEDRSFVFTRALDLIRKQIDTAVEKIVAEHTREKTRITNERERTEAVVNEMADGVVVVDENGKVLMMNPAAEAIYGVNLGESVGKPLWEGVREEQMMTLAKDLTIPSDRPIVKEVQIAGTQEAKRVLRASTAAVQDPNGRVVGMVSVLSDVTKQKELNRLQNEFMANVTHDLRAPMHAVKLAVSAILEGSAGATTTEQQRMLGVAERNVDRLGRLIDDLLDFSKIESGKMEIHPQLVEIDPLLTEAAASMESWAKTRGVTVAYVPGAALPAVFIDSDRILQVVNNLISNGIKFAPAGGRIELRAREIQEGGKRFVAVDVEDNGKGISAEDQKKIFERFVQLKHNEKMDIRGTGLGLSICRAFVDLHKGRLTLQSPPPGKPKGSLFTFTLPAFDKSAVPTSRARPEISPAAPPSPSKKRQSIWNKLFRFKMFALLALFVAGGLAARPYNATVRRVLTPTTIQLQDGTRVRLLGVSSPEKGNRYYTEAMAATRHWLEKKEVRLKYGLQERDAEGTYVAYVYSDGVFINEELVKQGLALVSQLSNEESMLPELLAAEREAQAEKRGQWKDTVLEPYSRRNRTLP
jgi:two-component system, OmpR family, phosphate regulon sensor histidine kinase PhoR